MNRRESFVNQRQVMLAGLVSNGHVLPIGAEKLVREAIREHDLAFHPDFRVETGIEDMDTDFIIDIPHGNPDGEILAGTIQRLGVKLEAEEKPKKIVPAFFVPISVQFLSNPKAPIYPDNLRYVGVDRNGNSSSAEFMLAIPEGLSGKIARVNVSCGLIRTSMPFLVK